MALVAGNLIFFLLLFTIQVGFYSSDRTIEDFIKEVLQWFVIPSNLASFSERPWTLLSYMFCEPGGHFLENARRVLPTGRNSFNMMQTHFKR